MKIRTRHHRSARRPHSYRLRQLRARTDRERDDTATTLSKAAYSAELQQVGTSLVAALNTLGQKSTDFARIERNVPHGQAALRQAARRLAATTAPADARTDNRKLVSGLRSFASG